MNRSSWWEICYVVKGNKRVKLEKLITREVRKSAINYCAYEPVNCEYITIGEERWNTLMEILKEREKRRLDLLKKA